METHLNHDQVFRFESGEGKCIIDNNEYHVVEDDASLVPVGTKHNVINTGTSAFKMYTIYSEPNHQDGRFRKSKIDAERKDEGFDGKTSDYKEIWKTLSTWNFLRLILKRLLKNG